MADTNRIAALAEIAEQVGPLQDLDGLLDRTLELVVRHLRVERVIVFLWDPDRQDLEPRAIRGVHGADLEGAREISRSALQRALAGEGVFHSADAQASGATRSVLGFRIRGLVAAPVLLAGEPIGAVYADDRSRPLDLGPDDLAFFAAFARQLGVSIENARRHDRLRRSYEPIVREIRDRSSVRNLIGRSAAFREVVDLVDRLKTGRTSVLLLGETGTGKELVARAIHYGSDRRDAPFVALNCAALPEGLLESELFGIEEGVATGVQARSGRFEDADGGTLFLDEVGDMAPAVQAKVLRVLQERSFERVGGKKTIHVDVRVVAATSRDVPAMVQEGEFREDLYYRLSVYPIRVPPLRERREDVPDLARHFLERASAEHGKGALVLSDRAVEALQAHDWPGNVRELANAIERAVLLARGPVVGPDAFRLEGARPDAASPPPPGGFEDLFGLPLEEARDRLVERFERAYVERALARFGGNVSRAAESMGLRRQRLHEVLRRLGIDPDGFRAE